MERKLAAAKAYLGDAWVLHPRYDPRKHPQHHDRFTSVLDEVRLRATRRGHI